MPIAAHSWGWLDQDKEKAIKDYFYPTKLLVDQISTERPQWNGMTYEQYLESVGENGAIFVGDSETVAKQDYQSNGRAWFDSILSSFTNCFNAT